MTYDKARPHLPAEVRRKVMTEAGHTCSVQHCPEHIGEVHHIDSNRENNDPSNLIFLCDKHHNLAHDDKISRMDLREYKRLLIERPKPVEPIGYGEYDKNLLQKINSIFTYDTIQTIKNESFGRFVIKQVIEPFHELFYLSEDPLFKFNAPQLEQLRVNILNKAVLFHQHFAQQSAGLEAGYEYIDLNDIRRRNPEVDINHWIKYSSDTVDLAQDFCTAMLLLRDELRNI